MHISSDMDVDIPFHVGLDIFGQIDKAACMNMLDTDFFNPYRRTSSAILKQFRVQDFNANTKRM